MADKYIIIDLVDVTQGMIDECIETSFDSLRLTLDEVETFLKWNGDTPATIAALDPAPTQYTYSEFIAILNNPANGWVEEE